MLETSGMRDAMFAALDMSRALPSDAGLKGYGVAELRDASTNRVKLYMPFANLITTAGDEYYAKQAQKGLNGGAGGTAALGMRLGTSNTYTAAKSGNGSYIGADVGTGSYKTFDSSPNVAAVAGTDTGWYISYVCNWAAGTVVNSGLWEVVIVNHSTNTAASNTYSRAVFGSAINKTSNDSLTVTWNHKFLGA